jgi:hypothetical protein
VSCSADLPSLQAGEVLYFIAVGWLLATLYDADDSNPTVGHGRVAVRSVRQATASP